MACHAINFPCVPDGTAVLEEQLDMQDPDVGVECPITVSLRRALLEHTLYATFLEDKPSRRWYVPDGFPVLQHLESIPSLTYAASCPYY